MPVLWVPDMDGLVQNSGDHEQTWLDMVHDHQDFEERVYLCTQCSSTLDVARYLASKKALDPWDSVLAGSQWAGRGQLRRPWVSTVGNLYVTWRLPQAPPSWSPLLSVLVGYVLCLALRHLGVHVFLKWPNDLIWQGRKVGGILLEERGSVLLAGLGLNLLSCPSQDELRAGHVLPAGSLGNFFSNLNILQLWLRLVHLVRFRYSATLSHGVPWEFVQSLNPVLAFLGHEVLITSQDFSSRGTLLGLSADGGVILQQAGQTKCYYSGSLTLER